MPVATDPAHRGREADAPSRVPAKGRRDVLLRVTDRVNENHLSMIAAGVAAPSWSATTGTKALIDPVNVAYEERETRGVVRPNAIALGLMLALVVFVVIALARVAIVPPALGRLGLGAGLEGAVARMRRSLLLVFLMAALASSVYVSRSDGFDATRGALGAIAITMVMAARRRVLGAARRAARRGAVAGARARPGARDRRLGRVAVGGAAGAR